MTTCTMLDAHASAQYPANDAIKLTVFLFSGDVILCRDSAFTAAREEARTTAQKLHEVRTVSTFVIAPV